MFSLNRIISTIATFVTIVTVYKNYTKTSEAVLTEEETNQTSNNQNIRRSPASGNKINSQRQASNSNAVVKSSAFNQDDFNNIPASGEGTSESGNGNSIGNLNPLAANSPLNSVSNGDFINPSNPEDFVSKLPADKTNIPDTGKKTRTSTVSVSAAPNDIKTTIVSNNPSSPPTTGAADLNTCQSDIAGGAFSNPIGVKITCTAQSNIKYCVGLGDASNCCDPLTSSALDYSTQVILGQATGTFCLSYYGQSTSAGDSIVSQQVFTFDTTLPNLVVTHSQIYYQTTQMYAPSFVNNANFINSYTYIHSTDFGKPHFGIGQINLKTHDPAAENLGCEQIVSAYSSLLAPAPVTNLSFLDVSLNLPSEQLEIPLLQNNIDYGDNYITTYIENRTYVDVGSLYSCHNAVINLKDFDYFQADQLAFSPPDVNSVREFTGAFSPYGFFEDPTTLGGSSGLNTKDQTGQKLEYGMFGSIY